MQYDQASEFPPTPCVISGGRVGSGQATSSYRGREQEPSMDPESQEDCSTIEDHFAEQNVRRYSTRSSAIVIVGLVVVLGLLYFLLR